MLCASCQKLVNSKKERQNGVLSPSLDWTINLGYGVVEWGL